MGIISSRKLVSASYKVRSIDRYSCGEIIRLRIAYIVIKGTLIVFIHKKAFE